MACEQQDLLTVRRDVEQCFDGRFGSSLVEVDSDIIKDER